MLVPLPVPDQAITTTIHGKTNDDGLRVSYSPLQRSKKWLQNNDKGQGQVPQDPDDLDESLFSFLYHIKELTSLFLNL